MNKMWNTLTSLPGAKRLPEVENKKPKTSGKLFDWCTERLKPIGLHIDSVTPYTLAVYRGGDVVGYYNNLTEIKQAIQGGYVHESYNL